MLYTLTIFLCSIQLSIAADLLIDVSPYYNGKPVAPGKNVPFDDEQISLTRADFFLSALALQKADGTWIDSNPDWAACFRAEHSSTGNLTDGVASEKFKAIRFRVGLSKAQNNSDPNTHEPTSALHPDVCGLHWGWQGGYVLMAIEGIRQKNSEGFSYHLANIFDATVEIPVDFDGTSPTTIHLALHIEKVLTGLDFKSDGTSTHSRDGDPLGSRLMKNAASAFSLISTSPDIFQRPIVKGTTYPFEATKRFPKVSLPADNPLTPEGIALGKRLFHDTRLSINNSQSCASCHLQSAAFADPRNFSIGAEGQTGIRNAMPLFNLAWANKSGYFWDGRSETLREQVKVPITDPHEMNETMPNVVKKLATDYDNITEERIALALEQFLLSLISQNSKFDRAVRKLDKFTPQEQRGLQLFITEHDPKNNLFGADCFHCHGGTLFTDHRFTNNGLDTTPADKGRETVTGNASDHGKFKTPSLRNIALTAPYMHDGRFTTLEEVIEHYNTGVKRSPTLDPNLAKHPPEGLNLSKDDKAALTAFLKTLTDEQFIKQP